MTQNQNAYSATLRELNCSHWISKMSAPIVLKKKRKMWILQFHPFTCRMHKNSIIIVPIIINRFWFYRKTESVCILNYCILGSIIFFNEANWLSNQLTTVMEQLNVLIKIWQIHINMILSCKDVDLILQIWFEQCVFLMVVMGLLLYFRKCTAAFNEFSSMKTCSISRMEYRTKKLHLSIIEIM